MNFLKTSPFITQLFKASLLVFAATGVVFPGVSNAQLSSPESVTESSTESGSEAISSRAARATNRTVLADGNYLFGQSPNPNELGSAYAVFSVRDNQTIGAFYAPHSSFDCFSGTLSPNQLSVEVVESYTQTAYPYSVAVTVNDSLTAGGAAGAYARRLPAD